MRDADPIPSVPGASWPRWTAADDALVVIDLDRSPASPRTRDVLRPALVIGFSSSPTARPIDDLDIVLTTSEQSHRSWIHVEDLNVALSAVESAFARNPMACVVVAQVLRASEGLDAAAALAVESLAYGMLQDGPEHAEWLANVRHRKSVESDGSPDVRVDREDHDLTLTFNRPQQRNAYRARTRDDLVAGLEIALLDDSITTLHLRGEGPSFGSGGDLSEFGSVRDGTTAHLIRSQRNAALLISGLNARTVAHVHGPCYGAGVELSAACSWVVADPDTTMTLPEVAMGLIPGAGGTWSIPHRIGRHRATWLAISGQSIDADRALKWGLVDELSPDGSTPT